MQDKDLALGHPVVDTHLAGEGHPGAVEGHQQVVHHHRDVVGGQQQHQDNLKHCYYCYFYK